MISQFVIIKAKYERGTIGQNVKYSIKVKLPQPPKMNLGVMYKFSHMLSLEMFSYPTLQNALSLAWLWVCTDFVQVFKFLSEWNVAFNLSTWKAEPGESLWVRFQPGLYRELQTKLGYRRNLSKKKKKPGVGVGGGGRNAERKILNAYIITCIPTYCLNKWMLMIMSFLLLKTLIIFKKYCSSQNFEL